MRYGKVGLTADGRARDSSCVEFRIPETPSAPYFDRGLNACVLSRYRDVVSALRDSRLAPSGAQGMVASVDQTSHAAFRADALRVLSLTQIQAWRTKILELARVMTEALPIGQPIDLMERYAVPWSLGVAGAVAGLGEDECARRSTFAREVFGAACNPFDPARAAVGSAATVELARLFAGTPVIHMQMFIALAHSLPAFLGMAWWALLEHRGELTQFELPTAMAELLRFAGPARAQFRQAVEATAIGGLEISPGQRVILMLDSANRDPEEFTAPNELRLDRNEGGHLAFGGGLHGCVGAALVETAATAATKALLERFHLAEEYTVEPADDFGMRYVRSLRVILHAW